MQRLLNALFAHHMPLIEQQPLMLLSVYQQTWNKAFFHVLHGCNYQHFLSCTTGKNTSRHGKSPPLAWIIPYKCFTLEVPWKWIASKSSPQRLAPLPLQSCRRPYNNPIHWIQHANPWCFEQSNPHTPASLRMFMQDSWLEATSYLVYLKDAKNGLVRFWCVH